MIQRVVEVVNEDTGEEKLGFVTNLFDPSGNEIDDPQQAVSFVVKLADDAWFWGRVAEIEIYTLQ